MREWIDHVGANGARVWRRFAAEFVSREREKRARSKTERDEKGIAQPLSPIHRTTDRTLIDLLSSSHAPHLAGYIRDGDDSEKNRLTPAMICGIVRSSGRDADADGLLADFAASGLGLC